MAVKSKPITNEVIGYTPISERNEAKPTTVFYKTMSKAQYDSFVSHLVEMKGSKTIDKTDKAAEILFKQQLAPNPDGIVIANVIIDDTDNIVNIPNISDAVRWLMDLRGKNLTIANEIEREIRGLSTLSEDEIKNSAGQ
jgi:hypothetical protein